MKTRTMRSREVELGQGKYGGVDELLNPVDLSFKTGPDFTGPNPLYYPGWYRVLHQYPGPIVKLRFAERFETETTVVVWKEAAALEAVKE